VNQKPAAVLVVDDDVDICRNVSDILTDLNFVVDVAHDGPSALELVRRRPYDLALLDLKMPGMDGLTLYKELRKLRAETVAIVITAFAGPETASEALAAGAWRVLPKPVDITQLLSLTQEVLEQPLVLVVDNDSDLCHMLWHALRNKGYRVALATDVPAAEEKLKDHSFRVVLIDLKISAGDSTSLFHLVRLSNPEARTLLITGQESEMGLTVRSALAEGVHAVCYRPFDVQTLVSTVEQLTHLAPASSPNDSLSNAPFPEGSSQESPPENASGDPSAQAGESANPDA
jgi:DNA-binding NtrC family response regulator